MKQLPTNDQKWLSYRVFKQTLKAISHMHILLYINTTYDVELGARSNSHDYCTLAVGSPIQLLPLADSSSKNLSLSQKHTPIGVLRNRLGAVLQFALPLAILQP